MNEQNNKKSDFILWFKDVSMEDLARVGGKNASIGQMISHLSSEQVRVPHGFAITVAAYWHALESNKMIEPLQSIMAELIDPNNIAQLQAVGKKVRAHMRQMIIPDDLKNEIFAAYEKLSAEYGVASADVAVRSSATAEDLPNASFAGQQETYLNVVGKEKLLEAVRDCMVSLFTDRAIAYRIEHQFDHFKVGLSVGVQKMVRSDKASSGVLFTLDTESGDDRIIIINAGYGLGEAIVQGAIIPDEYRIFKPTLEQGFKPIIKKVVGDKEKKLIYEQSGNSTTYVPVSDADRHKFCLTSDEIIELAQAGCLIEKHYSTLKGTLTSMDVEWGKDGNDGKLYILQARPETIHNQERKEPAYRVYGFKDPAAVAALTPLVTGQSIGNQIAYGSVCNAGTVQDAKNFKPGDIVVTSMTDPDWVPYMKQASAIITEQGGRTSHAAIVSRELGIPALVGAVGARAKLAQGQMITVDCSQGNSGFVYAGKCEFDITEHKLQQKPELPFELLVNIADPERAFPIGQLACDGVGLARTEFIIANQIGIHPMAAVRPEALFDQAIKQQVLERSAAYQTPAEFFVETLAQSVAAIGAAFFPRPVIVRLSDFKSNEYRDLLGGTYFEPEEENPMLGLRGASRYYSSLYEPAFALECAAMEVARSRMGLKNIKVMVPFVRTVDEAKKVLDRMKMYGLERGVDDLQVIMMCEIPSNVILLEQFAEYFDGFSIGSNDLTQTTLAVDRDEAQLASLFDERNEAVMVMMQLAIQKAQRIKKPIGICGQAPSDYPEVADALIKAGISSISLQPDAVVAFLQKVR